ncbi:hypothetical protein M513_12391 [Trichuris suis]|uniref:Uncharacterized protein n=1 Tax=Trichuris suis TaxID=68888 RepID=A0A085LP32_9BILA|nr:hypothetical protein M513_12391 [Trichuris suis]
MELLEDVAFSTADTSITLTVFKRHVDDVFAVIKSGKEEIFLEHLNSIFPNHISFTIEKEENGRLPFLDALVIRDGRRLKTTVYRKPTHSNRNNLLPYSASTSRITSDLEAEEREKIIPRGYAIKVGARLCVQFSLAVAFVFIPSPLLSGDQPNDFVTLCCIIRHPRFKRFMFLQYFHFANC